jgi:DNA-binding Lrp family transcriptional regulator
MDGASWANLATRCGTTPPTARRRVERLLDADIVELRCEVAQPALGPALQVTFLMTTPVEDLDEAGAVLASMPQCRLAASVIGPHNLVATVWLANAVQVTRFEQALRQRLPHVQVDDRLVTLRTLKRAGHVLDQAHRSERVVPLAVW